MAAAGSIEKKKKKEREREKQEGNTFQFKFPLNVYPISYRTPSHDPDKLPSKSRHDSLLVKGHEDLVASFRSIP